MTPLVVTARIDGQISLPNGPLALDALLMSAVATRDGLPPPPPVVPIEIPIAKEPGGRFHLCSFSVGTLSEFDRRFVNRRAPVEQYQTIGPQSGRVQITAGHDKSYRLPLEVGHVDGGELESKYRRLDSVLKRCESRAADVNSRIQAVEDVSRALFREWKGELGQYHDQALRRASERELAETEDRYEALMQAMHRAASRMEPVLEPLRDKVLFLKHNLNARAVASLGGELTSVERNVEELVREMEDAIQEADRFIAEMKS